MERTKLEWFAEGLRDQTAGFAAAADGLDPDRYVPTCPEWRVSDLVAHIGQAHRWGAGVVATGKAAPIPDPREVDPGPQAGWSAWLNDGAAELVEAVRASDGEATVWTLVGPRPATFWLRRMLHDTAVHHADLALAGGGRFVFAPDLAADAITEGLELASTPDAADIRAILAELRGTGQTIRLSAVGAAEQDWLITRTPEGVRWSRGGDVADVEVVGPVEELLLVFARRRPVDASEVRVTGDRAVLDHWLAHTIL